MYLVWIKNPILATWKLWNKVFWREHPSGQLKLPLLVRREAVVIAVLLFSLFLQLVMQAYHLDILRNDITRYDMKLKIEQNKNVRDIQSDKFSYFSFSFGGRGGGDNIFKSKCWESIKVGIHIVFLEREIICLHGL